MTPRPDSRPAQSVAEQMGQLIRVARELTADLDLTGVVRRTLALSVRAVDATNGSLILLDREERPALAILFHEGAFRQVDLELARRGLREGLEGWVAQSRQSVLLSEVGDDPRWQNAAAAEWMPRSHAIACVPLLLSRRLVGILTCAHPQTGHFAADDLQVLQYVAGQAAVAVENAQLFAAEEQRRELADTLSEIARTITATLDLDEVLNLILEQLGRVILYDSASIFLLQDRQLTIRAWRGFENVEQVRNLHFALDDLQLMARVLTGREPLVCSDVQQEECWQNIPAMPSVHGWIGAPLVARGEAVGVLAVDSSTVGAYSEADARVVAAFADHAAVAVANARLWQQIQRRLEEVAFLHRTGQALTASLEMEDVLRSLMDSVCQHFRVQAASVALMDDETGELVFRVATGAAADQVIGMRLKPGQGVAGWVVSSGEPILVPFAASDPRFYQGVDQATGFHTHALMAVPIKLGQQVIGVIEAINPDDGRLEENDVNLLLSVALLAASAIQNARHFVRARDAEQRYASLFENSADPIVITDADGLITDVNRTLCTMLGWEKDFLLGKEMATLHHDPAATRERLAQALQGESIVYNVEANACDGSSIPFEVRATRIFHGPHPFVQWVYHDLTERLRLEQIRQDLTRMIIHDLRNPISSILSSVDLIHTALYDKTITIPMDELFAVAQRSGQRLHLLIDSILDLARLEEGHTELARKRLDVASMVAEVIEQMRPTSAARELTLESYVPAGLPALYGDHDLLQRVLLNLLGNAMKFTSTGGRVWVEVSQPDAQSILFSVSDTGPGISPEYHEHIFDHFSRLDHSEVKGTGLGLAFCKLAIDAHGGRIWVESALGQGATFKCLLPVGEPIP